MMSHGCRKAPMPLRQFCYEVELFAAAELRQLALMIQEQAVRRLQGSGGSAAGGGGSGGGANASSSSAQGYVFRFYLLSAFLLFLTPFPALLFL
jgi:hypothetical protein